MRFCARGRSRASAGHTRTARSHRVQGRRHPATHAPARLDHPRSSAAPTTGPRPARGPPGEPAPFRARGRALGRILGHRRRQSPGRCRQHARRCEIADAINTVHRNPGYFPDVELPASLTATTDPAAALDGAEYLVLSIPAQSLRTNLAAWAPHIGPDTVIVSLMKGIELGSGERPSRVITEVTGVSPDRVAVMSGPNLAREIMDGRPAAATIACPDENAARRFQQACHTPYFRPYTSTDVTGCELGGAVKNVIALAVGIASGMGLGDNAAAMLVTRGLAETTRAGRGPGRPTGDPRRACRPRRPGGHLHLPALPQSHLRHPPR
ncbi:hypothetical protein ABZ153_31740 [Streptomyces sp. NPDC006290]|uniref:NAD(P)H-dependent glycerol-3-phosphate dehydrogenase n=1 Tax=Streptomyces sp. NPDC006290 TaxID=3156745 RepID=UPI0033AB6F41